MISASILKITDEDLRRYYTIRLDSDSNSRFFDEFLSSLDGRERDTLLGYRPTTGKYPGRSSGKAIRKGRYPALRFKNMCKNSDGKINPNEIRSNFNNDILCKYGSSWVVIDEKSKNIVWDAICDGL
jgi:hypothetical protein